MAQYSTDFTGLTFGQSPTGWTNRWGTTHTWTIEDFVVLSGAVLQRAGVSDGRSLLSMDAVDADANRADAEILARFQLDFVGSGSNWHTYFYLRASGAAGNETCYRLNILGTGATVEIGKYVNGTSSALSTPASTSFTLAADAWYWVRFRANGTSLQAKIWADGDTEPGTWTLSGADSDITAAGWVGVGGYDATPNTFFDSFAVATNGDTATAPVTTGDPGTDARVTRQSLEVLTEPPNSATAARITRQSLEVLAEPTNSATAARITRQSLEVLVKVPLNEARVTRQFAQVLAKQPVGGEARVTRQFAQVLAQQPAGGEARITRQWVQVLAKVSPGTNVPAGTAGLTITTHPATIDAPQNVETSTAGLTITTHPADVNAGVNVDTGTASFTVTTHPADINYHVRVDTGTAALTLSTSQANINLAPRLRRMVFSYGGT